MSFLTDVSGFVERASEALNKTATQVEIEVMTLVIIRSPVDSGRFRGNWQTSVGSAVTGEIDRLGAQPSIEEMQSVVRALKGGRVSFLSNNLPYASRLELDGWSDQAPHGMVRRTVSEYQKIVDNAARKNRI